MSVPKTSKTKILVVDDEPDNLDLLYRTFHRDYKVLRADSGPEALQILAKEGEVAVIISDQRMPLMSGTEFLSLTATQYPDIIRIILTGYTDVEDLVDAINAGKVFKYVTKPWDAKELKTVVSQAVDTHNVLKARTQELFRTLRTEALLNTVTNTIRQAANYKDMLQTIVETVGQTFEVSYCILRPVAVNMPGENASDSLSDEWFVYQKEKVKNSQSTELENSDRSSAFSLLPYTVWETQDVEIIEDIETDDRPQVVSHRQIYQNCGIRSSLVIPLIYRMELMAVLALHQCGEPRTWQDHEMQLVTMVADQASLALSQAQAYEQARSLAKRESLINTITTAIRSSLEPQQIFAAITEKLGQALHVDGCALSLWTIDDEFVQCVGLYDAEGEGDSMSATAPEHGVMAWSTKGATGADKSSAGKAKYQLPRSVVPIRSNPVMMQLLQTLSPVAVEDLSIHADLNVVDLPLRNQSRSLLVVPMLADGQIIGSISLRQTREIRRWTGAEIDLAQAVAAQAAIAVQQSRLYQKTRQQAERLMEVDRLKNELFQNISHEFRTPLTLTIGPLESAVTHGQDLPLQQAAIALRNSRRLLRLVNQLLDLQRLDAGKMQPTFRPCDVMQFITETVDSFRPYCEKKGITLKTDLNECDNVYLDLERFDKVLYNLLSNAMKFTHRGGEISVSLQQVPGYCLLQVKDTGIGIRTDQIPHLFERFRQAEGSVNRSYEGSGLGLALVKELVDLHGGQIAVESVYGEGSTFTVWLPCGATHLPPDQVIEVPAGLQPSRAAIELADVEVEELHDVTTPEIENLPKLEEAETEKTPTEISPIVNIVAKQSSSKPARVLIVDDNADLRSYLSAILTQAGYEVAIARNGAEGFTVAKSAIPDLIVTDLMMPLVSGLDMIRMIRENIKLRGIPIILLTARADEDTRVEGVTLGADIYLSKPFSDRELVAVVRNLLALKENERQVRELNTYLTESVLKRFLPPSMVTKAAAGELSLDLRPEPKLITILFSDIVGFTAMANTLRSRRVAEVLNEYLAEMTRAIFNNGGTVDKFVGDAVMAIFGAPEEITPNEQVRRAIASARDMHRSLAKLNERWEEQSLPQVRFRCGIHQGTAVVGMFGGKERADYTAIGPAVNIAARLQEAADPNSVLVSAAVADYMEDEFIKRSSLQLKGIDETVLTFEMKPIFNILL